MHFMVVEEKSCPLVDVQSWMYSVDKKNVRRTYDVGQGMFVYGGAAVDLSKSAALHDSHMSIVCVVDAMVSFGTSCITKQ